MTTTIYYVGAKQDGETAFQPATGITWFPGDSHAIVDDKLAARMLQHPDVFAREPSGLAKPAPAAPVAAPAAAPATAGATASEADGTGAQADGAGENAPQFVMQTTDGPLVLDPIAADELHAMAKANGVKVHHAAGHAKVAAALAAAFPVPTPQAD